MKISDFKERKDRLRYIEQERNISLPDINKVCIDEDEKVHCENRIGAISFPLGVAGPLDIKGDLFNRSAFIPLATTEGALVASVSRGCKAINLSGGTPVFVHKEGTTRGPVFYTETLEKQKKLYSWIKNNESDITKVAEETSSHIKLKKVFMKSLSNYLFVRFTFDTGDAMGMNMVTIATQKIVEFIEEKTGIKCLAVAGNFDIDKKPAWLNFIENRGFKAWAEIILSEKIVANVLKTTPEHFFDVWLGKCVFGSIMSGSLGFNAHFANIVAAFFAATGQDLAHVVEGSMGVTTAKVLKDRSLYFSVYMPSLMIGTVGGGTNLKTQTEARNIIGVTKSEELANVLIGAVLAGELSLMASISEGSLASVHKKMGR